MRTLGCYFFARGGVHKAFKSALALGYTAVKIHARHPYQTHQKSIPAAHIQSYRNIRRNHQSVPVFVQANKRINIASPIEEEHEFALTELRNDYQAGSLLEPMGIVVQAGYRRHFSEQRAIYQATQLLEQLTLELSGYLGTCTIILETSSGEGTTIGYDFEHFRQIIAGLSAPYLVEIAFDTVNVFAAGYDIATVDGLDKTLDDFHSALDIDRIACIHLGDADYPLGSKKRFHTDLGEGEIGLEALSRIVNHPFIADKPFILESMVDKSHTGPHPDYAVALELMEKLPNTDEIRKFKRLLTEQRFDYIHREREEQYMREYGIDDDDDWFY